MFAQRQLQHDFRQLLPLERRARLIILSSRLPAHLWKEQPWFPAPNVGFASLPVSLPFPFTFYGQTYTSANVLTTGNLQFGTTDTSFSSCLPYPQIGPAILPDWNSALDTAFFEICQGNVEKPCGVYTSVTGNAPNRIF